VEDRAPITGWCLSGRMEWPEYSQQKKGGGKEISEQGGEQGIKWFAATPQAWGTATGLVYPHLENRGRSIMRKGTGESLLIVAGFLPSIMASVEKTRERGKGILRSSERKKGRT